jgi:AraC family 4-hydroxyphenylacetate 3-monooxygenase operon regulatory protein
MLKTIKNQDDNWIPNIVLGKDYDQRYMDESIHYDRLNNLAGFFGREMPVHRHAHYLQIHYIDRGHTQFHIDDQLFDVQGPSLFLTPPAIPHSFKTTDHAQGHVLTVHQTLIWSLLKEGLGAELENDLSLGICINQPSLSPTQASQWLIITQLFRQLRLEWSRALPAKHHSLQALVQLLLIQISRLASGQVSSTSINNEELKLFRRFSDLIESHFMEHWYLPQYTHQLGISESRLNTVCQRVSFRAPKKLIHDRMIQEIKRRLTFTDQTTTEIGYELGFTDPSYFSRFIKRELGLTAQQYRKKASFKSF